MALPKQLIRLVGQAPVQATIYQLQRLRCNLCGKVFTAATPPGAGTEKRDVTVGSMIALLKYGSGFPFNRFEGLQGNVGIPLPASTQWEIVRDLADCIAAVYEELVRQAAQGDVLYNDDTTNRILELMGKRDAARAAAEACAAQDGKKDACQRRGIFTSGILSTLQGQRIALFFTGRQHAGENLKDVLEQRLQERQPPIQMCDALSRNMPAELNTILANCLAHGRRRFVDVAEHFPEACRHVLEALKVVYKNDETARQRVLSPEARLQFHQAASGPVMQDLHSWLKRQLEDHLVEPNGSLGEAINYMLKHWDKLTLFLRKAGAPLDNNICERALKKVILHRKNALFYKTQNGARVGDLFMSLIYTCELGGVNPFDYLNELQRHTVELSADPQAWMPWNYRQTLETLTVSTGLASTRGDAHRQSGVPVAAELSRGLPGFEARGRRLRPASCSSSRSRARLPVRPTVPPARPRPLATATAILVQLIPARCRPGCRHSARAPRRFSDPPASQPSTPGHPVPAAPLAA